MHELFGMAVVGASFSPLVRVVSNSQTLVLEYIEEVLARLHSVSV